MRKSAAPDCGVQSPAKHSPISFLQRQDGTTAIEFGIVAIPFFMFILGLMGVSTYFFMMTSLEKGMDQASRLLRTGQAQTSSTRWGTDRPMTVSEFKRKICQKANSKPDPTSAADEATMTSANGWIKCNDLEVFVQNFPSWDAVVPANCLNGNTATVNTAGGSDPINAYSGEANAIVIVTACYRWKFAGKIPYINLGQMADGSMMMQASTAFRTEPYSN